MRALKAAHSPGTLTDVTAQTTMHCNGSDISQTFQYHGLVFGSYQRDYSLCDRQTAGDDVQPPTAL